MGSTAAAVGEATSWRRRERTVLWPQPSLELSGPHHAQLLPISQASLIHPNDRASALLTHRQPFICALTDNAMMGDREVCLSSGMYYYLLKPMTLEALRDALGRGWLHYGKQQAADAESGYRT